MFLFSSKVVGNGIKNQSVELYPLASCWKHFDINMWITCAGIVILSLKELSKCIQKQTFFKWNGWKTIKSDSSWLQIH